MKIKNNVSKYRKVFILSIIFIVVAFEVSLLSRSYTKCSESRYCADFVPRDSKLFSTVWERTQSVKPIKEVFADAACGDGRVCVGTTVVQIPKDCVLIGGSSGYCSQQWYPVESVNCDRRCLRDVFSDDACQDDKPDGNMCYHAEWMETYSCCVGCSCESWSSYGPCSVDCGGGESCRTRTCSNDCDDEKECVTCNTHPCCSPVNGNLGPWGTCSNGNQTSTCIGFSCGGSCENACTTADGTYNTSTNVCTRSCLRIDGNIWSDDNNNGKELSDYWKASTLADCSTTKTHNNFFMSISGEGAGNQLAGWFCHSNPINGAYYNTTVPNNIEPESIKNATLSNIPSGYKFDSWQYVNQAGVGTTSGIGGETTNLTMPSSGWVNIIWKLAQQKYNLDIIIKEIPLEIISISCPGDATTPLAGAYVTVLDANDNVVCSQVGPSDENGKVTCAVWVNAPRPLKIQVIKTGEGPTPETYSMKCPCAIAPCNFDPGTPGDGATVTADVGLQKSYKRGWISIIDTDVFSSSLNVVIPAGSTNNSNIDQTPFGFAKVLLNSSSNNSNTLGFAFSESLSNQPNSGSNKVYETLPDDDLLGGYGYNLKFSPNGVDHDSKWLENFTFTPPTDATDITIELPTEFAKDTVYKISADGFNSTVGTGTGTYQYTISGGDGIAILYVNGDITIPKNITTASLGRLLIIVKGSVTITKDPGTIATVFQMSDNPNIMAGIIASGDITVESIDGLKTPTNKDIPVMLTAPLMSRTNISLQRDLYHDTNAVIPAQSVKQLNKYLYYLSALERLKSQDQIYFTGIATYDLDWEYIY